MEYRQIQHLLLHWWPRFVRDRALDLLFQEPRIELQHLVPTGPRCVTTFRFAEGRFTIWSGVSIRFEDDRLHCALLHVARYLHPAAS